MEHELPRYVVLDKEVGETPLEAIEKYRHEEEIAASVPLAYAGRLDPMADGKLLVLIGDECKNQTAYHGLDKEYVVDVVFGVSSDTGDVLGVLDFANTAPHIEKDACVRVAKQFSGTKQQWEYPHFSSRTVAGKPLHMWTLENRLDEIDIPTVRAVLHRVVCEDVVQKTGREISIYAREKIDRIAPVVDPRKALGRDFRREEVHRSWDTFREFHGNDTYTIARFRATVSSGTYMRTLAAEIGKALGTKALCYHIHRSQIGTYRSLPFGLGFWRKKY